MRITCPACGLNMELPGEDAWGILNCAGCGKRIRFGEPQTPRGEDEIEFGFDASATPAGEYVPRRPAVKKREWRKVIIAGSVGIIAMVMLVGLGVVLQRATPPAEPVRVPHAVPWDQAHRVQLSSLKSSADSLARQGKWQESYDAYQQILTVVGDHEVTDPVAVTIVEAVRPGQDRAMSALVAERSLTATTTPVEKKPDVSPPGSPASTLSSSSTTQATTTPADDFHLTPVQPATQATTAPVAILSQNPADLAPPLKGATPPSPSLHAYTLPNAVTDEQIGEAINKGVAFLSGQFTAGQISTKAPGKLPAVLVPGQPVQQGKGSDLDHASDLGDTPVPPMPAGGGKPPGHFEAPWTTAYSTPGIDALCVYALLNAGRAMDVPGLGPTDPFTEQSLTVLKSYDMNFTYHRSLRAAALGVFARPEDNAALEDDVRWLINANRHGGYTYTVPDAGDEDYDNSNSQYGLLGVWSGAQAGIPIPQSYWSDVQSHWNTCAVGDGTWNYAGIGGGSSLTMTCAGVASLLVSGDYLEPRQITKAAGNRAGLPTMLDAGLAWLDAGDNSMKDLHQGGMGGVGYGLYGLERVGLASGFKYFGRHDWYSELAKALVAEQNLNGSWGIADKRGVMQPMTLINTAYALLFLARGRHPILFNKLRYNGNWNNRPHDVAHLARYASQQLERPINWQVVNLRRDWFDWMDCPVLYLSGDKALPLTEHDCDALRDFADGGGLIFTHADGGSPAFNKWVETLVRRIFPKYELMQVPRDHPLYSTVYHLTNPQPLLSVSNGSRLLLIHSPTDVAGGWQLNWTDEKKPAFQMGVNLFVYAAGKGNLKNRLASSYIPQDPDRPDSTGQVARLKYAGEWDPEPYAWTRFARYFQWETHQAVVPMAVEMKALEPGAQPLAVLTGTVAHDFTDAESVAARAYVAGGGVLLIDACGGAPDFGKSVIQTLLPKAFPGVTPVAIADNHPLLLASRAHADDLVHPLLRSFAIEMGGKDSPLQTLTFGRGWVIFSRLDLTTGLLGTQSWGIRGYSSAYAQALVKNAVLWAGARSHG